MALYHPDPNPYLATSSLLFLIPAIQAAWACDIITAVADSVIVVTSVGFHLLRTDTWFWLDQFAIQTIILNAFWRAWMEDPWYLSWLLLSAAYNIVVYYQGRKWRTLTYHDNYWIATGTHASIHFLSAAMAVGLRIRLGSACTVS
jgi:hypothetical protein